MYEHTINVPLIIAGPDVPTGKTLAAQCYLRDLFPTVGELAGITVPNTDGVSLVPVMQQEKAEVHPFLVGYFQDSQRMIREGHWKLAWYPKIDRWQLFDLAADPLEMRNLVSNSDQQPRIAGLRAKLLAWLKDNRDPLVSQ
jgi:arylsulfatase A-like enzyme